MKVSVTGYPYATAYGSIEIPDGVEDIREYIENHFDEVDFGSPETWDFDFCGTDYEAYEED